MLPPLRVSASPPEHLLGRRLAPICLASYDATTHADRPNPGRGGLHARWLGFNLRKVVDELVASSSYPEVPIYGTFTAMSSVAKFWDSFAEKYAKKPVDDVAAFEQKKRLTRELLRPDATVLEIGCGTGSLALELAPGAGRLRRAWRPPEVCGA